MNSGGRKRFIVDSRVRILLLTGEVSEEVWLISVPPVPEVTPEAGDDPENEIEDPKKSTDDEEKIKDDKYVRADRKGHIFLREEGGSKEQKIHFRRVLPVDVDGKAPVIESGDKYRAVCPGCGRVEDVDPSDSVINCPKCGETQVHWLGVKPMTETTAETGKKETSVKPAKKDSTKKPAAAKKDKPVREVIRVDFDALKALNNCELWTKGHVKFDHPDVDVRAHALVLVDGESSRKLCFNTYDGALGKKSPALPIDEFVNDGVVKTGKREKPWFAVKDLEKARAKLVKDGYEQQK